MTAAPLQLVNQEPEKQETDGTPEWVKVAGFVLLVVLVVMLAAHWGIQSRRYGPGRR